MTTERDPRTYIVLSWLGEEAHENAERVLLRALNEVDTTPQRRSSWPAWRTQPMTAHAKLIAAAAAVLVVAIGGYQFLPGGFVSGGASATPSPSPSLIARGNFMTNVDEVVELEATREGSSVTGRMTVSAEGQNQSFAFTVDLQCARTTEDGLIMIGGVTTDSTGQEAPQEGTWAGIILERGSPVGASTWRARGESQAASCLASLHEQDMDERSTHPGGDWTAPIVGTVELGP